MGAKKACLGLGVVYLLFGVLSTATANPLSALSDQSVNRLEFGIFKAQYQLSVALLDERGDRLEGSDLTFQASGVHHSEQDSQVVILGMFSSGWGEDLTRGACTDALSAFQKRVIASAGRASSSQQYLEYIFGSSAADGEFYSDLLKSVSVAAVLHDDDRNPVVACKSNLEGKNLTFEKP